jgi:WD40 repeat protein
MAVLKTQCPECDAKIRLTVDGAGPHETECPKCGHEFAAKPEPVAAATATKKAGSEVAKKAEKGAPAATAGKKAKVVARIADDDDEDEDEAPKKKGKKGKKDEGEDGNRKKMLIAGGLAGVLLLGGLVAVVVAVSGKDKSAKKPDADPPPAAVQPNVAPPVNPVTVPPKDSNTTVVPNTTPGGPKPPPVAVPKKEVEDAELATLLPPPPRIRMEGSLVPPPSKPVVKPPAIPPLTPEEDPFVRAKNFDPAGVPLPELPKLPARTQRPMLSLDAGGHTAFVEGVFFTPDGKRLITVGRDKAVRIWDPTTGMTLRTVRLPAGPGEEGMLLAAALSKNGKKLAVGGVPAKDPSGKEVPPGKVPIYILSPDTGVMIRKIDGGSDDIRCLSFSSDGNRLAVGCADGYLQVFNVNTGQQIGQKVARLGGRELRFNPQPQSNLVASLGPGGVLVADVVKGNFEVFRLSVVSAPGPGGPMGGAGDGPPGGPMGGPGGAPPAPRAVPTTIAWANDGKSLAIGFSNGLISFHELNGKVIAQLPALVGDVGRTAKIPVGIIQMQFTPDGELAVVGSGRFAAIVNSSTGEVKKKFDLHPNTVTAVDVSPDGTRVVSCGGTHHDAMVWEAATGKVLHRLAGTGGVISSLGWSKDGKSIAWGHKDRTSADEPGVLEHTFRLDEFGLGGKPDPEKYTQTVTADEGVSLKPTRNGFFISMPGRDPKRVSVGNDTIYSATLLPKGNAIVAGGIADIYLINPATLSVSSNPFIAHTGNVLCVTPSPDGRYFATGSVDQTIRIWRRDKEDPLLSIFVADREWVAWTPEGYYACSPQGEKMMAWQLNTTKGTQVHPAERFRKSLYQPALLKYIVPAGDMPRAMAMAKKYDKELVNTSNVADVLPPEVTLEGFGETEVKVEKDTVTVKATAKGAKHPIASMRLLVNGRPFQGAAGVKKFAEPQQTAEVTWEVPVVPGTHTFAVIADTGVSRGMSRLGIAFRPGEPPKPNLYVLAMGISDYPGPMKLNFCATDAQMLAKAFQEKSTGLFNKIELQILTDKQCTRKGMLEGLDWLKSKMTPQDVGIVSFSGHGARIPLFNEFYLVTYDFNGEDPGRTGLSGEIFKDRLNNMPGRLVAILDACHSGMAGNDGKKPPAEELIRDLTAEDSGVIVMSASLGREYAAESKICKAGFYTLALVEGMSGHADIDGDGIVYLHELDLYATTRVRQLSMNRQNPTFSRPASVRPFPIARVDKPIDP